LCEDVFVCDKRGSQCHLTPARIEHTSYNLPYVLGNDYRSNQVPKLYVVEIMEVL